MVNHRYNNSLNDLKLQNSDFFMVIRDIAIKDMVIKYTQRLRLRHLKQSDSEFLLKLYNQPAFIENIGDRGVHSLDDAEQFITKTQEHYENYGFWLFLVEDKMSKQPVGVSGLLQRDYLDAPDIGFALDQHYWSQGFALESALAVLDHAKKMSIQKVAAIVSPNNNSSINLLQKLGFHFIKYEQLVAGEKAVNYYEKTLSS